MPRAAGSGPGARPLRLARQRFDGACLSSTRSPRARIGHYRHCRQFGHRLGRGGTRAPPWGSSDLPGPLRRRTGRALRARDRARARVDRGRFRGQFWSPGHGDRGGHCVRRGWWRSVEPDPAAPARERDRPGLRLPRWCQSDCHPDHAPDGPEPDPATLHRAEVQSSPIQPAWRRPWTRSGPSSTSRCSGPGLAGSSSWTRSIRP